MSHSRFRPRPNKPSSPPSWSNPILLSPPQPPRSKRKLILVTATVVLLIVLVVVITLTKHNKPVSNGVNSCLTAQDYTELTTASSTEINSGSSFYTYAIEFEGKTLSYAADNTPTEKEVVKKVGDFYKSHRDKSIAITLNSVNSNSTGQSIASQRLQKIQSELVAAGVSSQSVVVNTPTLTNTEPGTNDVATIAITNGKDCQE